MTSKDLQLEISPVFEKQLKQLKRKDPKKFLKFSRQIKLFLYNPANPQLHTHKLTGKLAGYFAFSIDYSLRVVFKQTRQKIIKLITLGSHDNVYR